MTLKGGSIKLCGGLFGKACFLIENSIENLIEPRLVRQQDMKLFQVLRVVAPGYPDFQISFWPVLFMEVLDCPLIMSGSVELRIIRQSISDGAPDYRLRFDEAVGFGNQ